jgi:SRSO17 transposase
MGFGTMIAEGADRFTKYLEKLTTVLRHADRAAPLRDYCTGLLVAQSVEPKRMSVKDLACAEFYDAVRLGRERFRAFTARSFLACRPLRTRGARSSTVPDQRCRRGLRRD